MYPTSCDFIFVSPVTPSLVCLDHAVKLFNIYKINLLLFFTCLLNSIVLALSSFSWKKYILLGIGVCFLSRDII